MLHNFAANVEMYGVLDAIGSGPIEARMSENSTMASLSSQLLLLFSYYYFLFHLYFFQKGAIIFLLNTTSIL